MTRARLLTVAVFLAGVWMGGIDDPRETQPPRTRGGYTVLAADFHVHSFPDGLPPWDVAREARRRRLDAVALTSHNSTRAWWLWTHAPWIPAGAAGLIVLPGEELTGVGYHMAVVGITNAVDWRQPIEASIAAVHAGNGVAIVAHPLGVFASQLTDAALQAADGVEVAHPAMEMGEQNRRDFLSVYARASKTHPSIAAIGSSDFHYVHPIGGCRTYVFAREATPAGVLEALRAGRTVACDLRGNTYGPPALTALVAGDCRSDAAAAPAGESAPQRAGVALAWLSLLALVLLGFDASR